MKNVRILTMSLLFSFFAVASCKELPPEFVHELIQSYPIDNNAHEIWQYRFEGETVYYIPPQPYDIPSSLYDSKGEVICSPDGGLTGFGDNKCPTFFQKRRGGRLIWKVGQEAPDQT